MQGQVKCKQCICIYAGTLSWLSGCALWGTSMEYVRRNYFEVGQPLLYFTHSTCVLPPGCQALLGCSTSLCTGRCWLACVHCLSIGLLVAALLQDPHPRLPGLHAVRLHAPHQPLGVHHARHAPAAHITVCFCTVNANVFTYCSWLHLCAVATGDYRRTYGCSSVQAISPGQVQDMACIMGVACLDRSTPPSPQCA